MGSGKLLFLVLFIAQFLGYAYSLLKCHSCGDDNSPCLNGTALAQTSIPNPNHVECSIRNAFNYGQIIKNTAWNDADLHLSCGKLEYRSQTGRLIWQERGCYVTANSTTQVVFEGFAGFAGFAGIRFSGTFCATEEFDENEYGENYAESKRMLNVCLCNSHNFCNE